MNISIISNSCQKSDDFIDNVNTIKKGLEAVGFNVSIFYSNQFIATSSFAPLAKHIIFLDKDIFLGKRLEEAGYILFNNINSIALCDDKALTDIVLRKKKIRQLKTIYGPLIYTRFPFNDEQLIDRVIQELSLPLIIKECHGSFGLQVYLCHSKEEILTKINQLNGRRFLFQEKANNDNVDYRLQVIGEQVVVTIKRSAPAGSFISNITSGGKGELVTASPEMIELALAACRALKLDFAGVDLIKHNDQFYVLEVNSNGRIGKISKIANIDIALQLGKYLKSKIE